MGSKTKKQQEQEEEVKGNGHKARLTREEIEAFEEAELDKDIPGKGYLFHVKNKHLPESSRLNEKEIIGFSVGKVQQAVLDKNRTESAFDIFMNSVLRMKISFEGEGRKENIILHQLSSDDKAEARGGLYGDGSE